MLSKEYREAAKQLLPSDRSKSKESAKGDPTKRKAPEALESGVAKAVRLSSGRDDDAESNVEVKEQQDARDEKITRLTDALQKAKAKITRLESTLEQAEDQSMEYKCRVLELEARESQRVEKEKVVQTSMHAAMKTAGKQLEAQQKSEYQQKLKEMRHKFKEEKEELTADNKSKLKKAEDDHSMKLQKEKKQAQAKLNNTQSEHKEEVRTLKEKHKEETKALRPDHSKAMKEKTNELKAKDTKIASLEKSVASMDALTAEKESLADKLNKGIIENARLTAAIDTINTVHAQVEGQYQHKLEHEGQRWQIQHSIAEDVKMKLTIQQRSNSALRMERSAQTNRMQALERELQASRAQNQTPNPNAVAQAQDQAITVDSGVQTSTMAKEVNENEHNKEDAKVADVDVTSTTILSGDGMPVNE